MVMMGERSNETDVSSTSQHQHLLLDSNSVANYSHSSSRLTKAAMARRFLLRRRKETTTTTMPQRQQSPISTPHSPMKSRSPTSPTGSHHSSSENSATSNVSHRSNQHEDGKTKSKALSLSTKTTTTTTTTAAAATTRTTEEELEVATCLLCYDDMNSIDAQVHPVVCMNCTFNCCTTCMNILLQQQQQLHYQTTITPPFIPTTPPPPPPKQQQTHVDETSTAVGIVASNVGAIKQQKIKCPNCRTDLSRTIYDTALLRSVDQKESISSSRTLQALLSNDVGLQYEIDMARKRESQFKQYQQTHQTHRRSTSLNCVDNEYYSTSLFGGGSSSKDEMNSADIEYVGRRTTTKLQPRWYEYDRYSLIDPTLLCGLQNIMSWYQQELVTRYYTSLNTNQLSMAAKLLYQTQKKLQQQQQISVQEQQSTTDQIYHFIEAGKKARFVEVQVPASLPSPTIVNRKKPEYYTKLSTQKATQFRKMEHEIRQQTAHIKRYPLPNRLPKYCECSIIVDCTAGDAGVSVTQLVKRLPFRFCNDQWDGTIMDAYTKFIIQRCTTLYDPKKLLHGKNYSERSNRPVITSTFVDNYKVHQRRPYDDINIQNILGMDTLVSESNDNIDMDSSSNSNPTDDARDVCTFTNRSIHTANTGDDDRVVDDVTPRTDRNHHQDSKNHHKNTNASRVMIASVVNMNVANMIFPGDVVTHINGIELFDHTVDDVIALLCSLCDMESAVVPVSNNVAPSSPIPPQTPPPPPPPSTSPLIAQTFSMIDETFNLFTNTTSSTSFDTATDDRSIMFSSPPSPKVNDVQQKGEGVVPSSTKKISSTTATSTAQKVLQLQFVFNADEAVAKALYLRSKAIHLQQ